MMSLPVPKSYLDLVEKDKNHRCADMRHCVKVASAAKLPSRFGTFTAIAFHQNADDKEHAAFVKGEVLNKENVLVRMHSECLTGDAIGSLRCDCREQLEASLMKIEESGEGMVLYLRQEGRGIGLTNKLKAYQLQDEGLNTVEANLALGFPDDLREYHLASHMLKSLGVRSVRLLTNNPNKVEQLTKNGIDVVERVPHRFKPNIHNEFYLKTKKEVSKHLL